VIEITIRRIARACFHSLRFDARKKITSIFRRSRVVVVSQSNRNCDIGLRLWAHVQAYWHKSIAKTVSTCRPTLYKSVAEASWGSLLQPSQPTKGLGKRCKLPSWIFETDQLYIKHSLYTVSQNTRRQSFFVITLANIDRFLPHNASRGIITVSRSCVRPSVSNVEVPWAYRLD